MPAEQPVFNPPGEKCGLAEYLRHFGVRYVFYSDDDVDTPASRAILLESLSARAQILLPKRWALLDRLNELEERYPLMFNSKGLHVLDLAPSTSERNGQP